MIPTGVPALDLALGIRGMPRGRIVEIYGPESSGKTTLAYHVIAEAQRLGGQCALIDAEHSMDPRYADRIGVDLDALLVCQPDHGEQALEVADTLVRSGELAVVCIDSVAALIPKAELEGRIGDQPGWLLAAMMTRELPKLARSVRRADTLCVFTNQLRHSLSRPGSWREATPGGRAMHFYAAQRLEVRPVEMLTQGAEPVGIRVRAKVISNSFVSPGHVAEFAIEFGSGISAILPQ